MKIQNNNNQELSWLFGADSADSAGSQKIEKIINILDMILPLNFLFIDH